MRKSVRRFKRLSPEARERVLTEVGRYLDWKQALSSDKSVKDQPLPKTILDRLDVN